MVKLQREVTSRSPGRHGVFFQRPDNLKVKEETMKAKVVEKVKFAPGKWKEAGALMKTFKEVAEKQGFPTVRIYGFISGGDCVQTLNFVTDWDSLGAMETVMDKMFSDPEMLEMMEKWAGVVESHEVSILKELSPEELGM